MEPVKLIRDKGSDLVNNANYPNAEDNRQKWEECESTIAWVHYNHLLLKLDLPNFKILLIINNIKKPGGGGIRL